MWENAHNGSARVVDSVHHCVIGSHPRTQSRSIDLEFLGSETGIRIPFLKVKENHGYKYFF